MTDDDDIQDYKKPWQDPTDREIEAAFYYAEFETSADFNTDPAAWCKEFAGYLNKTLKKKNA